MVFTFQLLVSFTASTASMYSVFAGIYSATQCQQRDTERGRAREEETGRGTVDAQRNHRPTGERGNERDGDPRWERRSVSRSGNIYLRWTDITWGCSAVCKNCRDRRGTRAYLLNLSRRSVFHYPPRFESPDRLGIVYLLCAKRLGVYVSVSREDRGEQCNLKSKSRCECCTNVIGTSSSSSPHPAPMIAVPAPLISHRYRYDI